MIEKNSKEKAKIAKLFEACKTGTINTQMFKKLTGRAVRIGGRADYSKYSGRQLREIRALQARKAIAGQTHYLDGTPVIQSRIVDS